MKDSKNNQSDSPNPKAKDAADASKLMKLSNILNWLLFICVLLILPIQFTYLGYVRYQLTNESFDELHWLNEKFQELSEYGELSGPDEFELKSQISGVFSEADFKKYWLLDNYLFEIELEKYYYANPRSLQELKVDQKIVNLIKGESFLNRDSLSNRLRGLMISADTVALESCINSDRIVISKLKPTNKLLIGDHVITKLKEIKDKKYGSFEEFESGVRQAIGIQSFEKYDNLIGSVRKERSSFITNISVGYIIVFVFLIIAKIGFILFVKRTSSANDSKLLEDKIDKAKVDIEEHPSKILPIWDLANLTLQKYYNKNISQINSIYLLSVIVMLFGFALISSVLISSFYFEMDFKLESLGIVAGIITEFIGATFLFIYKSTVTQALQHSKSLEAINNVGMSIKIIESIEKNAKNESEIDAAKIEIAKKLIQPKSN